MTGSTSYHSVQCQIKLCSGIMLHINSNRFGLVVAIIAIGLAANLQEHQNKILVINGFDITVFFVCLFYFMIIFLVKYAVV